jgi:2-octaprenyl-6-methoxyphenol hydroxylase
MADTTTEVAVIGAGPAGLVSALALARLGVPTTLVAPPFDPARAEADKRTTALIGPSVEFLKNLGAWKGCTAEAAPFTAVRIADDRGTILRAPEVVFRASEAGIDMFGVNVPNAALVASLHAACRAQQLPWIETAAVALLEPTSTAVRLRLAEGGSVTVRLAVAADGRNSIAAAAAGIALRSWTYPQAAIVASFSHTRSHDATVNELHRRSGPLTTVPLAGLRSSLVWVEEPREAARIAKLPDEKFAQLLEDRMQGVLGAVHEVGPRALYPLAGATAERMAARRIALVGEAAHVVPPIGAQGLNLGMRDAAALADCVAPAEAACGDVGGPDVLDRYQRARVGDVAARSAAIDLLNRSLLTELLPLDLVRGAVSHLMAGSPVLRRLLMMSALGNAEPLPRLMRPNAPGDRP